MKATKQVCSQMFLSDNALISCNTSNIININNSIALCELDYEVAPVNKCISFFLILNFKLNLSKHKHKDTDWVYGYLEAARNKCKFNLQSDISFYLNGTNGTMVIDESKLASLCSNNCSNNGVCSSSGLRNTF